MCKRPRLSSLLSLSVLLISIGCARSEPQVGVPGPAAQLDSLQLLVDSLRNVVATLRAQQDTTLTQLRSATTTLERITERLTYHEDSVEAPGGPILVVDGMVQSRSARLADISALDIDNIEIIKGAAAASIYGNHAQRGAVVIETSSRPPPFPWPPQQWSSRYVLPAGLAIAEGDSTLGDVEQRLLARLRQAGIPDWSIYSIGDSGFAVVSRLETIKEDGAASLGADRWTLRDPYVDEQHKGISPFDVTQYLRALLFGRPGRYRIIAFLVTDRDVVGATESAQLPRGGPPRLSASWRRKRLPPEAISVALVYEFYRKSEDDDPEPVSNSHLTAVEHLKGAGLWSEEELR